jgi:hypothetical protein
MKSIEIQGKLRKYIVQFVKRGYSYAEVHVYTRDIVATPKLFGLLTTTKQVDKKVWEMTTNSGGWPLRLESMEKKHPDELLETYNNAIDQYEKYKMAWDEWDAKGRTGNEPGHDDENDSPSGGGGTTLGVNPGFWFFT